VLNEGTFSFAQMRTLIRILKSYSTSKTIFCYFDGLATLSIRKASLSLGDCGFTTDFDEFMDLVERPQIRCSPTTWWGDRHDWFFHNDVDSSFATFGGTKVIASKLLVEFEWKVGSVCTLGIRSALDVIQA
jgi:hypothetical protein